MRRVFVAILFCLTISVLYSGCGPDVPKDLPKTVPCYISIVDNDKPVEAAQVEIFKEGPSSLSIVGQTDASGKAEINTFRGSFVRKGIPEGTFTVVVSKPAVRKDTKTPEEIEKMSHAEMKKYEDGIQQKMTAQKSVVPAVLSDREKSPLKVEVTKASKDQEVLKVDLSKHR